MAMAVRYRIISPSTSFNIKQVDIKDKIRNLSQFQLDHTLVENQKIYIY